MDERLKQLLRLVVEDVIKTGEPVGSHRLVETYGLTMSPATIRNWFAALEDEGYLHQPHTSSGRVPTEKGYRFYLQELMEERALRRRELQNLQRAALMLSESADMVRRMARTMAELARDAVLMSGDETPSYATGLSHLLAHPEFTDRERIMGLGEALDRMDDILSSIRRQHFQQPTALIGSDCPFGESCGSVFLTLSDGTLLGILGPLRMDYSRGMALLRSAKDIIEQDQSYG